MQKSDLLQLATRMFKARKGRTALTILGMGIGIGAILFMVGLGYGLQRVLLDAITTSDSLLTLDVSADSEKGSRLNGETVGKIESLEGVAEVVSAYDLQSQLKFEDISADATGIITSPALLKLEGKSKATGKSDFGEKPKSVVLTSAFSRLFETSPEEMIGKPVFFSVFVPALQENEELEKREIDSSYEIVGVIESEETVFYVSESELSPILSGADYSRLKVKSQSSEYLDSLKTRLSEEGYSVSSLSETVNEVNKMFRVIKIILALFGTIALLVSAIGMFNTMTVALLERTKEIGIMKSIGASETDILLVFLLESSIMGFLGGVAGVVLGVTSGIIINLLANIVAWRMGGQTMMLFHFPAWFILFIIGFSLFIGFLTGVVPARRASTIDPLDALRSK